MLRRNPTCRDFAPPNQWAETGRLRLWRDLVFFWQDGLYVAGSGHFTNDFNGPSCTVHLRTVPKLLLDQYLAEIGTSRLKSAHRGIALKSQLNQHPDRTAHRGPLSCHRNLVVFRTLRRCLARLKTEKPDPGTDRQGCAALRRIAGGGGLWPPLTVRPPVWQRLSKRARHLCERCAPFLKETSGQITPAYDRLHVTYLGELSWLQPLSPSRPA